MPTMSSALGIRNPQRTLPSWSPKLEVLDKYPFCHGLPRDPRWEKGTAMMMNMNNWMKTGGLVHTRFLP